MLRPSTMTGRRMSCLTRAMSRWRNSFHSVTRTSASAPAATWYASFRYSTSGRSNLERSIAAGSKARTSEPAARSTFAISMLGASTLTAQAQLLGDPDGRYSGGQTSKRYEFLGGMSYVGAVRRETVAVPGKYAPGTIIVPQSRMSRSASSIESIGKL